MSLKNAFEELSVEETQQSILYMLAAILEKLPRLDTTDRVLIQASESTTPTTISSGTVTTVSAITAVNGFSGGNSALMPSQMSIGLLGPIYDNLVIT